MNSLTLFSLFSLFAVSFSQQLINLNTLKGRNVKNSIGGSGTYSVYVSAYSDAMLVLNQIYLVDQKNTSTSLYTLKNNRVVGNAAQISPFALTGSAYLTTSLPDSSLKSLSGVMFVSSSAQYSASQKSFLVFDVDRTTIFKNTYNGNVENTIVFLNSYKSTRIPQSSLISSWTQDSDAKVFIYQGIPSDGTPTKNTQIFSNPVFMLHSDYFFSTVEKFTLSLPAFYVTTYRGVQFRIEPGYVDVDGTTTSDVTTTGFYMKPDSQKERTITFQTKRDTRYNGTAGTNTIGSLPNRYQVSVGVYDGASSYSETFVPYGSISYWTYPYVGQTFKISSTGDTEGYYFVQYFLIQGSQSSVTTKRPSDDGTTKSGGQQTTRASGYLQTTTSSSSMINLFVVFISAIIFCHN